MTDGPSAPAGWYDSPDGSRKYWDGRDWAETGPSERGLSRRRLWMAVGVLAAVVLVAVAAVLVLKPTGASAPAAPVLAQAFKDCGFEGHPHWATLGDGGRTLTLDTDGKKDFEGAQWSDVECVRRATGMPDSVVTDIEETRALDGRQEASWGVFTASWRYHPDPGLKITFTEQAQS